MRIVLKTLLPGRPTSITDWLLVVITAGYCVVSALQWRAMRDSNEINARAWITAVIHNPAIVEDRVVKLPIVVTNIGHGPALHTKTLILTTIDETPPSASLKGREGEGSEVTLPPSAPSPLIISLDSKTSALYLSHNEFFVWFFAWYADPFADDRFTRLCFHYFPAGTVIKNFRIDRDQFAFCSAHHVYR